MSLEKLGLKCGIEVHQQLEGQKLFCSCPTLLRDDAPHFRISRKLRASAGESREVDIAARQEQLRNKTFIYEGYHDTTCLLEGDEEPPQALNKQALYTALQFSKIVNANISPIIPVMRKIVVDGSNTAGFQRTALIARDGEVSTALGKVRITNISLEEDSAKIIAEGADFKTYRLDRLGIPLIEIGTAPDIKTPEQCQEAAQKLGLILRSLPGIKRGLGSIRQDINVSIIGGTRVEIKGAQDLKLIPLIVELEMKRQEELIKIRNELEQLKLASPKLHDLTSLLAKCDSKVIQRTLQNKGKILAIKLTGLRGYLGRKLQPDYRVGTELAGRAKIKAGVGGIFHSDELPNYGIAKEDVDKISRELKCVDKDAFVLVADAENKAKLALEAVYERTAELMKGVPAEVRKANPDGSTSYLRPIPGADRMYPETDVPLIFPETDTIQLPELLEEKIARFQEKLGLGKDLAAAVTRSEWLELFEDLAIKYPLQKPAFIAETLVSTPLEIKRKYGLNPELLTEDNFRSLFMYLDKNKIHKDIVLDVLIDMIRGTFNIEHYFTLGTEAIHKKLKEIVDKNKEAPFAALMGLAMKELAGKASGKFISEELKKILEKNH
ncbi:Glu-tRNA(Gln) amidotransferase subunit GatE [Candidatus Woesearchaeota archaeon]|nr:Glu-tRNA(Gln) amidotransferase subunit GatE [Candidatus Woesearchaeota archaeon]